MFKNLRQQYQTDLENHNIKKFTRSTINLRCKTQASPTHKKSLFHQTNKIQKSSLLAELSEWNDRISNYQNLKYYTRSRSSRSKQEGFLSPQNQQILLSLPYHCVKIKKIQFIRKMWRKYFYAVNFIVRYAKFRYEAYKSTVPKLCISASPRIIFEKPKRKRNGGSLLDYQRSNFLQNSIRTFGEYVENFEGSGRLKQPETNAFKRSQFYQSLKSNDARICRILNIRNNSINTSNKESPTKINQSVIKINKLPPLINLDKRLKRVHSNLGK